MSQLLASSLSGTNTANSAGLAGYGGLASVGNQYSRKDVSLTLKITPHINDDNQVRLEIDLKVSFVKSVDPQSGPSISQKMAKTTAVVGDQKTIVIGGLITDSEVQTVRKVPVLGDIPILVALFRSKSTKKIKQNLLIFLTPYIIRNADDFRAIFERKMAERREFIERWTAFEHRKINPHLDWERTSGVISTINSVVKEAENNEELRKQSEISGDVEHNRKNPITFNTDETNNDETTGENKEIIIEPTVQPNAEEKVQ